MLCPTEGDCCVHALIFDKTANVATTSARKRKMALSVVVFLFGDQESLFPALDR